MTIETDWDKSWAVHDWHEDSQSGLWPYSDAHVKLMAELEEKISTLWPPRRDKWAKMAKKRGTVLEPTADVTIEEIEARDGQARPVSSAPTFPR